jgi:di/tricarboxylate transporter
MTQDQIAIILILAATIGMFLWGRWRHDLVAAGALLACVFAGLVPHEAAFAGFGHPAVITVACVLILSSGLQLTGAVDAIARTTLPVSAGPILTIAALTGLGALLSAFMNNVGALALLMPVALQLATKQALPAGKVLMPLAFGTILGGMTTMIGTPPNLIVAGFREQAGMGSFAMFDFTPVGLAVAGAGVIFITLIGWRLVPTRKQADTGNFDTGAYFTEVRITEASKAANKPLREVEQMLEEADAQIVGMVRNDFRLTAPNPMRILRVDDILVLEADHESITTALSALGLKLEEAVAAEAEQAEKEQIEEDDDDTTKAAAPAASTPASDAAPATPTGPEGPEDDEDDKREADDIVIQELVVMPQAELIGRSATDLQLRTRFGLNLLAVSRQGRRSIKRLRATRLAAGDVLLFQGASEALAGFAASFGCLPLAPRPIRIPDKRAALIATLVMVLAVCGAAFGLLPAAISFATGVLVFMGLRIVPLRKVYDAIDWPVIVLLGALMPVANAMAVTGTSDVLAEALLESVAQGHPVIALALVLVVTMTLSDFTNNTATAAVMCPIAISTATQLGNSADAFLMAVAIGASCSFLTPIGHQNNTLILGPGGFRFGDYWRLGLPLEILVVAVSLPMLLWVWPL